MKSSVGCFTTPHHHRILLPLLVLLVVGNSGHVFREKMCLAFQQVPIRRIGPNRHSPSQTRFGTVWTIPHKWFRRSSRQQGSKNDDDDDDAEPPKQKMEEGWEFAMELEGKEAYQPSTNKKTTKDLEAEAKKVMERADKAEAEAKKILEQAEKLKAQAEETSKLKAEQEAKLKQAEAELARLKAEAEARRQADEKARLEAAATKQAEIEKTQSAQAQKKLEEAAKAKAEAEAKKKAAEEALAKQLAEKKAAEEALAKQKAAEEAKQLAEKKAAEEALAKQKAVEEAKQLAEKKAAEEALAKKKAAEEAKQLAEKKAKDIDTLIKAKEEAARVMAEIDAKLKAETAQADIEEAERVAQLQADAEEKPALDAADDELLTKMMEEMEKVRIELESRLKAETEEKPQESPPTTMENESTDAKSDLMARLQSGASYKPSSETKDKYSSTPVDEALPSIDTTATSKSDEPPRAMPDLSSTTKAKSAETKTESKEDNSKPKWMVDWGKKNQDDQPSKPETDTVAETKEEESPESSNPEDEKDAPTKNKDPRTVGRSSRENLFDVIGRTAGNSVSMDELTKKKKKTLEQQQTPPPPEVEVLNELKKKGPPESFGQSVAASYRTGKASRRTIPDNLFSKDDLKKKGPPADFGSFAAAASGKQIGNPPKNPGDTVDNGPPASFGASVAMAGSGDVPQELLSRGTASTDAGASPAAPESSSKNKRKEDNNIIDVLDVEYTKKDEPPKKPSPPAPKTSTPEKSDSKKEPVAEKQAPPPPAPPLQVEKVVPPIRNKPKSPPEQSKESTVAKTEPIAGNVNIGKAAVDGATLMGKRKENTTKQEKTQTTAQESASGSKSEVKEDSKEKGMEERVAELLKEAFSLSKEDSRVADLLQGVVAITTGKDKDASESVKSPKTEGKASSPGRSSPKSRKGFHEVAPDDLDDEELEDDDDDDEISDSFDDDEAEEENTVLMGRGRRTVRPKDPNSSKREAPRNKQRRRRPPPPPPKIDSIRVENEWGDDGFIETPISSNEFDDGDYEDDYFEDDDDEYFEYDENDRWRGRDPRRSEPLPPPMGGRYSVRPPRSSSFREPPPPLETEDDYYFLKFGGPQSPFDNQGDDMYYDDQGDYWDDEDDGVRPGDPRPAFVPQNESAPKGPPSNFGNFVADASMAKTGYAPSTMKDEPNGNGSNGGVYDDEGDEWGNEMSANTGSMLTPRTKNGPRVNGSGGAPQSRQQHFVVSEDQSGGGRGKKGPPSNFGKSVASASESQTGFNPMQRSIEEEIANGGMATPTGGMATPKRKRPVTPPNGDSGMAPPPPPTGQQGGAPKKPLFIVSDEDVGTPDFGSSVAEASGARTGWAPKMPKRPAGGLEGGTTGGMRPIINKKANTNASNKKEFGSAVSEECPPVEPMGGSRRKSTPEKPLSRKQAVTPDSNQKSENNPSVKLVDGGASKRGPRKVVQYSGSMMAPRIVRKQQPLPSEDEEGEEEE